jgi:DNA gyrase subunit B
MPKLIYGGHIYVALPPLYGVRFGNGPVEAFFSDDEHFADWAAELNEDRRRRMHKQRFKGLGEMNPEQLWVTTMNPEGRLLRPVSVRDAIEAEDAFGTLMGAAVDQRREWIEEHATYASDLDY